VVELSTSSGEASYGCRRSTRYVCTCLHIQEADDPANVVNIMIMRKETFSIHAENEIARDQLMKDLLECIEFAATGEYS
jgi:hypothetical protein